jgi:endonuclease III
MDKKKISEIMDILGKFYDSNSRTTLNEMRKKPNAFKILISCLLSLRIQDSNTKKASEKLFSVADTPKKIVSLPIEKIEKLIYSSGHYKKKARIIKNISKILIKDYGGEVPKSKEELLKLKGVGPKTANIVLSFAFNQNVIPVDTHVHRISNRLGFVNTKKPEETEIELMKILPEKYWKEVNALLVLHGRSICAPISPKCSICPIEKYCEKREVKKSR